MTVPQLREWKTDLIRRIHFKGQNEEDLAAVIYLCQDALQNMAEAFNFVQDQRTTVTNMLVRYQELYRTLFNGDPPPRPSEGLPEHLVLNTAQKRKSAVRDIAVRLTEPGMEIGDQAVLGALESEGMRFVAQNPAAAISTILYGFTSEFEKVEGVKGVFRRKERESGDDREEPTE